MKAIVYLADTQSWTNRFGWSEDMKNLQSRRSYTAYHQGQVNPVAKKLNPD